MKKWILTIAVVLVAIGLFLLTSKSKPKSNQQPTPASVPTLTESSKNQLEDLNAKNEKSELSVEEKEKLLLLSVAEANTPIVFYGKVIDQDKQPIPGVRVTAQVDSAIASLEPKVTLVEGVVSDAQGQFSISGYEGMSLAIKKLEKEGYLTTLTTTVARWQQTFFSFSGEKDNPDFHKPNPQKPVIFNMWKRGVAEPLLATGANFSAVADGRPYTVDLLKKKSVEGALPEGDLRIQVKRPVQVNAYDHYEWTLTIDAINGGIVETSDVFLYRAPTSGYEAGLEYVMSPTASTWNREIHKQFYLKSRGGKVYASLDLQANNTYLPGTNIVGITISSMVNPAGSPNLEYDRKKIINSPWLLK